jgi:hypothetical protein
LGIDFTQERFEAVAELSVPRQERWTVMDMSCLVYLILLKPKAYAAGQGYVVPITGVEPLLQCNNRVPQSVPFLL